MRVTQVEEVNGHQHGDTAPLAVAASRGRASKLAESQTQTAAAVPGCTTHLLTQPPLDGSGGNAPVGRLSRGTDWFLFMPLGGNSEKRLSVCCAAEL